MGEVVEFPSNGSAGQGYLAGPAQGAGLGQIVIQEWWGLVDHIKDVVDRFAAEGFTALAPDLYRGDSASNKEPDEAGKLMMTLNLAQAGKDLTGAVDYLVASEKVRGDGIGVVGFCMGGGLALMLATQRPDAIAACVPFYGLIPWEQADPDWSKLAAPVLGHYAANDSYFGPDKVAALQQTLADLGKEAELLVYEGADHAFFNDTGGRHHPEAATQAWTKLLAWFDQHLV